MINNKFITAVICGLMMVSVADAGSIGRSGGGTSSSSSSMSRSSPSSARSAPSTMPSRDASVNRPGGIGGNASSMGVRKPDVTAPAQSKLDAKRNPSTSPSTSPSYSNSAPTYGSANVPTYGNMQPSGVTNGSTFVSALGGSLVGSMLGNMLSNNHGHGGTTIVNNGTPSTSAGTVHNGNDSVGGSASFSSYPQPQSTKKEYTMWSFIGDLIGFVLLVTIIVAIAWLFYKGYKMIRNYINRERGISAKHPINPSQQFWNIQSAFSTADVAKLQTLLGPDLVDEFTNNLTPSTSNLHNLSHEVILQNPTEFSVHYTFDDSGERFDQVWHYELHDNAWKLNGIENI